MKGLVKTSIGAEKLELKDVEIPEPAEDEVRIKVGYAGICGTDLHIYTDDAYPTRPPVIIGHELSGVIDKCGKSAVRYKPALPVVSETYFYTCGVCRYCRTGHPNLCMDRLSIGSGVNGAFAEYVVVPEKNIHIIPDNISLKQAALCEPLACCVQAVYEFAHILPEDFIIITGPGTIGLLCLEVIKTIGCNCIVIGTQADTERLELAGKLGADYIFNVSDDTVQKRILDITGGYGADYAFECSGSGNAVDFCLRSVRKGASLIQVGLSGKPIPVDTNLITLKELVYYGTFAQKWEWWEKSLELMAAGKLELDALITAVLPLEQWQDGFIQSLNKEGFKIMLSPELSSKPELLQHR